MPKTRTNKTRKVSKSQDVTGAPHGEHFELVEEDVHRHILSFLMCLKEGWASPPKSAVSFYRQAHFEEYKANNPSLSSWKTNDILERQFQALSGKKQAQWDKPAEKDEERYVREEAAFTRPSQLVAICQDFSLVSKHWRDVAGDVMNSEAPAGIITPHSLFKLKCHARSISLSSVSKNFIKDIKEKWGGESFDMYGDFDEDECNPLQMVISQFGASDEGFAKIVAEEYSKFLVIKSVETLATNNHFVEGAPTIEAWKEKCQPSQLVDLFSHAHMLSPQKYALDCHAMIGELVSNDSGTGFSLDSIINHDAGYVSSNVHAGSDYMSKRDLLFQFEKQFPSKDYFSGRLDDGGTDVAILFSEKFDLCRVASAIWEDMQGYN